MEANKTIKESNLNDLIKKRVILIGGTGTGKSTLLNMLFNDDFSKSSCITPAMIGNTSMSVTHQTQCHINTKSGYLIYDTVGLGDPDLEDDQIVQQLRSFLRAVGIGIDLIIVVARYGRASKEARMNFELINEVFEKKWKENAILVLTHYEEEGTEAENLEKWMKSDPFITKSVEGFKKIILTNNSIGNLEQYTIESRKKCLENIQNCISSSKGSVFPIPLGFLEVLERIVMRYFSIYRRKVMALGSIAKRLAGLTDCRMTCGNCSICKNSIHLESLLTTNCNHVYHINCWNNQQQKVACLVCGCPITQIYINKT